MTYRPELDFDALFSRRGRPRWQRSGGPGAPRPFSGGAVWLTLGLLLAVLLGWRFLSLYLDWLWFSSLDLRDVLATRIVWPLAVFAGTFVVGFAWLAANVWPATSRLGGGQAGSDRPGGDGLRRAGVAAAAVTAALVAVAAASSWPVLALWAHRVPFGVTDGLFHRDVAFHVFTMPVLLFGQRLAATWIATALLGVLGLYSLGGLLLAGGRRETPPVRVRAHLLLLAAAGALVWSAGVALSRYDVLHEPGHSGLFTGADYTTAHVIVPAYALLAVLGAIVAALLVLMARGGRWRPAAAALLVTVAAAVLLVDIIPPLVQRFGVEPNEFAREAAYIEQAITMTRRAHALDEVQEEAYEPKAALTAGLLADNAETIANVRLWDWRVLQDAFEQLQEIRTYYRFADVDVDRYATSDGSRQVMLALREMEIDELRNPTWMNERLLFTHGYGLAMAPVDEFDSRGQAVLWARDIPVVTTPPLAAVISQPRVYFGQTQDDAYVVVGSTEPEFDYPAGEANEHNAYDGQDGVALSSYWRRLLYALRFGHADLLVSRAVTKDSRILLHRNVTDRVRAIAPFLSFDADPYPVLTRSGRLVWILDAFTVTDRFPYSQAVTGSQAEVSGLAGANYVRNSVKVVIDAYDGAPTFYVVDPADPLVRAWSGVYPSLFEPAPAEGEFVEHWRYPETLFRARAQVLQRYHMTDAAAFYNAEDLWSLPTQTRAQGEVAQIEPYYVTMRLRGEKRAEFVLMLPFAPARKELMIAWLAARCDPPNYGRLVLYRFSKGQQVDGPRIVESRIDNDTEISAQLTLWDQAGSRTIRGNLLAIPLGDSLLYVEPLYLQASEGSLPELKRVIAASSDHQAMETTLEGALRALLAPAETATAASSSGAPATKPAASAPVGQPTSPAEAASTTTMDALLSSAAAHERAARAALARGDWSTFGSEMDALQADLDSLTRATGAPGAALPLAAPAPSVTMPAATPAAMP